MTTHLMTSGSVAPGKLSANIPELLASLEARAAEGKAFDAAEPKLEAEVAAHPEIANALRQRIESRTGHPRVRWLLLEMLAGQGVPDFVETLLDITLSGLPQDETAVGTLVALRHEKVPAGFREELAGLLRGRLDEEKKILGAKRDPLAREILAEAIATFGSYAQPQDLTLLGRFWRDDEAYKIRMNSLEEAAGVACFFPNDTVTDTYFRKKTPELTADLLTHYERREQSSEAGSLMWGKLGLLLARLGPEADAAFDLAQRNPRLRRRILHELSKAETNLLNSGQDAWLKGVQPRLAGLRRTVEGKVAQKV